MSCRSFGVSQVMVGLHRVGLVGLADALRAADESGLGEREALIDLILERLASDNYFPAGQEPLVRATLWRELLRFRGEDFSEFYSEIEVTVCGEEGDERESFVQMLTEVLAEFELRPVVSFAPPGAQGANPQLVINDETLVRGCLSRQSFKLAVRRSVSDW